MAKFKKAYNFKMVTIVITVVIFCTSTVYGAGISGNDCLRIPLTGSSTRLSQLLLCKNIVTEFGLGDVQNIEYISPGYSESLKGKAIPVVTTSKGKFLIRQLSPLRIKTRAKAEYVTSYISYLKENGIPILIVSKVRSNGKKREDFFTVFINSDGKEEYYAVDRWIEEGIEVSRKDASSQMLFNVGKILGKIHDLSSRFSIPYPEDEEEYSLKLAIEKVLTFDWHTQYEGILDEGTLELIDEVKKEIRYFSSILNRFTENHILSDLNFGNMKFDESTGEIIAIFDYDNARLGYNFEDVFGILTNTGRPEEGRYLEGNFVQDMKDFLNGNASSEQPFTLEEKRAIYYNYLVIWLFEAGINVGGFSIFQEEKFKLNERAVNYNLSMLAKTKELLLFLKEDQNSLGYKRKLLGIKEVFSFLSEQEELPSRDNSADILILFGNDDIRSIEEAAKKANLAKNIVVSGYRGRLGDALIKNAQEAGYIIKGDLALISEAEIMKHILVANGVPEEKIILEDRSTNTKENVDNVKALLKDRGISYRIIILMQKPLQQKRARLTFEKAFEQEIETGEIEYISYAPYIPDAMHMSTEELAESMALCRDEFRRFEEYGPRGKNHMKEVEIDAEIANFYISLISDNIADRAAYHNDIDSNL